MNVFVQIGGCHLQTDIHPSVLVATRIANAGSSCQTEVGRCLGACLLDILDVLRRILGAFSGSLELSSSYIPMILGIVIKARMPTRGVNTAGTVTCYIIVVVTHPLNQWYGYSSVCGIAKEHATKRCRM